MEQELDLKRYLDALVRRWWVIVALAAAAAGATLWATPRPVPSYEASASVVFEPQVGPVGSMLAEGTIPPGLSLTTQMELMRSPHVFTLAASKVYPDTGQSDPGRLAAEAQQLQKSVSTKQLKDSGVVVITARAPDPDLAVRRANAMAEAYIEHTNQEQATAISRDLDTIAQQLQTLQHVRLEASTADLSRLPAMALRLRDASGGLGLAMQWLDEYAQAGHGPGPQVQAILGLEGMLAQAISSLGQVESEIARLRQDRGDTGVLDVRGQAQGKLREAVSALDLVVNRLDAAIAQLKTQTPGTVTADQVVREVSAATASVSAARESLERARAISASTQVTLAANRLSTLRSSLNDLAGRLASLGLEEGGTLDAGESLLMSNQMRTLGLAMDSLVQDLRFLRNAQTSPLVSGALLTAEEQVLAGAVSLAGASELFGQIGRVPTVDPRASQLSVLRERTAKVSSGLSELAVSLDSQAAATDGADDASGQQLLVAQVKALRTSLSVSAAQVAPARVRETDPMLYALLLTAEEQFQHADAALAGATNFLEGTSAPVAEVAAKQLLALEDLAQSAASSVDSVAGELGQVRQSIEVGQPVPASTFGPLHERLVSASAAVTSLVQGVDALLDTETNPAVYSSLQVLAVRLGGMSSVLSDAVTSVRQMASGAFPLKPWHQIAREQVEEAHSVVEAVAGRLEQTEGFSQSAQSGADLGIAAGMLELASAQVQAGRQGEDDVAAVAQLIRLGEVLDGSRATVNELKSELTQFGKPSTAASALYRQLIESYQQLQLSRLLSGSGDIRVASPAVSADRVRDTDMQANVLLGAGAGLLLGVLSVLALEYLDRRLRTQADLRRSLALPVLGAVPVARGRWDPHPRLVPDAGPLAFSEAVRMLRTNVEAALEGRGAKVLLVTSPQEGDGKTTLAANLARSIALEKRRVLLVDGDLRRPDAASSFGMYREKGLGTALRNGEPLAALIARADGVDVLPGGEALSDPADVLSSEAFRGVLRWARGMYDTVILDGPPAIGFADTLVLARNADAVLLVVRARRTTSELAQQSAGTLATVSVPVIGTVLNMAGRREAGTLSDRKYRPRARRRKGRAAQDREAAASPAARART